MVNFLKKTGAKFKYLKDFVILPFTKFFNWLNFKPIHLTFIALILGLISVYFLAEGKNNLFFILILLKIIFDGFDGALARFQKKESKLGFWLDYGSDRLITLLILFTVWEMNHWNYLYMIQIIIFILVHILYLKNRSKTSILYCDGWYSLVLGFNLNFATTIHLGGNCINLILLLASLI